MQDALLPGSAGAGGLLPTNTQIFSSTVRYGKAYHATATCVITCFVVILIAGTAMSNKTTNAALVGSAFGILGLGMFGLYLFRLRVRAAYEKSLGLGEWHEGVIVFPSGDVVVRFSSTLGSIDKTIEARTYELNTCHKLTEQACALTHAA